MNEKLRKKYREILKKNITQITEGVDKDKIGEHIADYKYKVTLDSIEEIAKRYLSENECNVGEDFRKNFEDTLRQKIINTAKEKRGGFERIKLKQDLMEQIQKAIEDNPKDKAKLNDKIDEIVTKDTQEQIVSKISVKDLTDLISKTLEKKGSIEMNRDFKNLQEPIESLNILNKEAEATSGNQVYSTEQILDLIMNKDIT